MARPTTQSSPDRRRRDGLTSLRSPQPLLASGRCRSRSPAASASSSGRSASRRAIRFGLPPRALPWPRSRGVSGMRSGSRFWRVDCRRCVAHPARRRCDLAAACWLVGMVYGVRAAGGSDPSGYVSQSSLWPQGHLRIDHRFSRRRCRGQTRQERLTPLGYRTRTGDVMVPTYAPGLPLLMARRGVSPACGPYLVSESVARCSCCSRSCSAARFSAPRSVAAGRRQRGRRRCLFMALTPMADLPSATFWLGALAVPLAAPVGTCAGGGRADRYRDRDPAESRGACRVPLAARRRSAADRSADGARRRCCSAPECSRARRSSPGSTTLSTVRRSSQATDTLAPGFAIENGARNLAELPLWWLRARALLAFIFVLAWRSGDHPAQREVVVLMAFAVRGPPRISSTCHSTCGGSCVS